MSKSKSSSNVKKKFVKMPPLLPLYSKELMIGKEKYFWWVMLKLIHRRLQSEKSDNETSRCTLDELLNVRCTSMLVKGMSEKIMLGVIDELIEKKYIKKINPHVNNNIIDFKVSPSSAIIDLYELTTDGNIAATQHFNRILNYKAIKELTEKELSTLPRYVTEFYDALKRRLQKPTIETQIWIAGEVLVNYYLLPSLDKIIEQIKP